ncbi:hypothetical protein [Natrinema sp. SYSU A 869]|uniref:DHH family phosphoesterase n=1 Tax=Natrinema sp. SYSU A 869 TaxID=2871694 RepID=UPI001CA3FFB4|nr:hypothetical protein [Natrinema sp. SYSU A 869]
MIIITHTDADGLSSAALVADYFDEDVIVQPIDYNGAFRFEHVLEDLVELVSETPIWILDFALDDPGRVEDLAYLADAQDCHIVWHDHHQWDDDLVADLEAAGVDLRLDEDECTASLVRDEIRLRDYDAHLEDLAECTKDIDLWIKDDPRSERLNVFASLVDDPWEYIDVVLEHGPDLPDDIQERIDERLERDRDLEESAIENRTAYDVGGYSVAITYVRGGRSSQIGNDLVEELSHDIAVICKPHGGVGIYAHSTARPSLGATRSPPSWVAAGILRLRAAKSRPRASGSLPHTG